MWKAKFFKQKTRRRFTLDRNKDRSTPKELPKIYDWLMVALGLVLLLVGIFFLFDILSELE